MRIYCHKKIVRYYDHGTFLESAEGLCWSPDGKVENSHGFERGDFEKLLAEKRKVEADCPGVVEIIVGETVERRVDYNPHGLV